MIAMIATIVEIELRFISAIVVATIATFAEEWLPYDRNDHGTFFSAIVAIAAFVAVIWKPALRLDHDILGGHLRKVKLYYLSFFF